MTEKISNYKENITNSPLIFPSDTTRFPSSGSLWTSKHAAATDAQCAGQSSDKRVINFNFPISSARRRSRISMFTARVAAAAGRRDSTLTYVTCNEDRVTRSVPSVGRRITQAQGPSDVNVPSWFCCRLISFDEQCSSVRSDALKQRLGAGLLLMEFKM